MLNPLAALINHYQWLDLTHPLQPAIPTWNGNCGFNLQLSQDYNQGCRTHHLTMQAGIGTHMDAPAHFIAGASSIADIPLEKLLIPAYVLDVSAKAHADYLISAEDILAYEQTVAPVAKNSLFIAHTGWSRYWGDAERYRNQAKDGRMHFPAFSKTSADLLVTRNVAGIAIDTLSPDSTDSTFSVHHSVLGAGKYIIENLANTQLLPPVGAYILALPLRLENATESPLRIIAFLPK